MLSFSSVYRSAARHVDDSPRPLLKAESLVKRFGGITALEGDSVDIGGGELLGLIADAIKRADGKALRDALAATKGYKVVTGQITYSRPSGVPLKGVSIISVHDGKYKVEEVWTPGTK